MATAQDQSPVYVEDSPAAGEAIARARDFARVGNDEEAARVLQSLLDRQGSLLVPRADDEALFVEARTRVHEVLLGEPSLLETYMELESATARAMLETGDPERAERTRLLTEPGFDAALRLAQEQLESARFGSAWVTLMELDRHPSRADARGRAAASLAEMVAGYLDSGAQGADEERSANRWKVVERWSREAGLEPPADRHEAERPPIHTVATSYDRLASVDVKGIMSKPLASAPMGETVPDAIQRLAVDRPNSGWSETARVLHAVPTVAGDVVYVNNSESITAFDRFTLTRLWRTSLIGPPRSGSTGGASSGLEDTSGVAISEPYAIALTGLSLQSRNSHERLLGAFDMRTGELAWATSLAEINEPSLQESLLRGPLEVSEGTILLSAVRAVNRQRLLSVEVVAFDAETGDLRWVRQIGSVGVVPWVRRAEATELASIRDGVMYRADRIGVVAAIEIDSGRVRWIRRMERDFSDRSRAPEAWSGSRPILLDDGRLVVLNPDRRRVSVLDSKTGAILDSTSAVRFGQPQYLLRMGDFIVSVEERQVTARPIEALTDESAPIVLVTIQGGIQGRVVVAGDRLMVPYRGGVRMVRVDRGDDGDFEARVEGVALEDPGHSIAAPGQIITVDDVRVHSYLSWEVADQLLRQRMDDSPRDASPAITYADLAYRAGRPDRILEAVDRAMATIERDPLSASSQRSRERLFGAIMEMIEPPPHSRPGAPLDEEMREALIGRLSRVASTPPEQVAFQMAAGRLYETTRRPEQAVERYQEVLSSPVLSKAVFQEGGRKLPAEAEATRRLRRLIRLEGREVYAAYEAEAERLLNEARNDQSPEPFDRIARRFPVSRQAPAAWLAAADRYRERGEFQSEILSLEEGLAAAQETLTVNDATFGELAGRLITALIAKDRLVLADQRLAWIRAGHPTLVLRASGNVLDGAALAERIRSRLGERARCARIGPEIGGLEVLEGWTIARPLDASSASHLTKGMMMEGVDGRRAMFALDDDGELGLRWSVPEDQGDLLRVDHRSVYFASIASDERAKRTVTRYDRETGRKVWETPGFADLFDGHDPFENIAGRIPVADTPLQPDAPLADLFAVFDAETMVLVERTGRAAAFDIETGELLWAHERGVAPIQPVHDVAAGNGFVAIAGRRLLPAGARGGEGNRAFESVIAAHDLRNGHLLFEHVDNDMVRWLRVTPEGQLLAGLDRSMLSLDAFRQRVRWRVDRSAVRESVGAWVFPGRAVYRDTYDTLRLVSTADGSGEDEALPQEGRLDTGFAETSVVNLGDRMLMRTRRGVVLMDNGGSLLGVDVRRTGGGVLMPAVGERYVVMVDSEGVPVGGDDPFQAYDLNVFDLRSVKLASAPVALELGMPPSDVELLDGKVLVSAGMMTVVIDAPPDERASSDSE